MRALIWVFVGIFAALVMGRGAQAQTLVPACTLMAQATAAAINGAPVSAGQEQDSLGNSCVFNGNGNNGTVTVSDLSPSADGISPVEFFKLRETKPLAGETVTPVSGIGDGAYFLYINGLGYDLYVLKGQVTLDVNSMNPQGPISAMQAAMLAAAKIALKAM
jgi:hypothetical protein